ncbi:MAG: HEAT repeat domain-containing protein [Planctomycetota bacterium]|jgi:HEAT repeat protein|nr:HEAT repeat domain-containing protein [Planctomycetota bacterium]
MTNRFFSASLFAVLLAIAAPPASPAGDARDEVIANNEIIGMARAGLAPDLIVAKIRTSRNAFDLSTRAMIALKENGVADRVIDAMLQAAENQSFQPRLDAGRLRLELAGISSGNAAAKTAGIAWIAANREQAIPMVRQAVSDAAPEIRSGAILAIGQIGDRDGLPAIRARLTDPAAQVRRAAAQVLYDLKDDVSISAAEQAVARQLSPLDGYARLLGHAKLTRAAAGLGRVLEASGEAADRIAVAWALGEIGRAGIAGRPALENVLASDPDPQVRREAAEAVAKFGDTRSAVSLQDSCRKDPAIRNTTLAALANYPEATEFLIGVMNLGPDQITADELETARASLYRLTSEDFGLDGRRWTDWFVSRSGLPRTGVDSGLARNRDGVSSRLNRDVDIAAWGIVADSSGIPMAPQVDDRPLVPPGGVQLPLPSDFPAPFMPPQVSSDAPRIRSPDGRQEPPSPPALSAIPDSFANPATPAEDWENASNLRTWSSIADPAPPARSSAETNPSGAGSFGFSNSPLVAPPSTAGAPAGDPDAFAVPSGASSLRPPAVLEPPPPPVAGIVSPLPAGPIPDDDSTDILRGLSLPMPPMDTAADSSFQKPPSSPVAAPIPPEDSPPMFPEWDGAENAFVFPDATPAAAEPIFPNANILSDLADPELTLEMPYIPPSEPAPEPAEQQVETVSSPLPSAPTGIVLEQQPDAFSGGVQFVEPAPGQLVLGEPLAGPGESVGEIGTDFPVAWPGDDTTSPFPNDPPEPPAAVGAGPTDSGFAPFDSIRPPAEATPSGMATIPAPEFPEPEPFDPLKGSSLPPVSSEGLVRSGGGNAPPPLLGGDESRRK